jgi:hypothetical protein
MEDRGAYIAVTSLTILIALKASKELWTEKYDVSNNSFKVLKYLFDPTTALQQTVPFG